MIRPPLTALAAGLPDTVPFVGPEAIERRLMAPFRARLGANESGFGPSPRALEAMRAAAGEAWMYGDPEVHDLRLALERHHGLPAGSVVVGEGVDGLLGLVARLHVEPGTPVVTSLGGYPTFDFHAIGFGGRQVKAPYRADRADLGALADAVRREGARLVYLANPDNPMGTWWDAGAVTAFIDALPGETLLILDEAYGELAPAGVLPPLLPLRPNVLRMRTFSKAYGLAGLRVGYAIGEPALIAPFERVRNHFGVGRIAQAGALAALEDRDYLEGAVGRILAARERLAGIARANGLSPVPSATNFVTMDCGGDEELARRIVEALSVRGVFIRKPGAPGLGRCIRVSMGPDEALDIFEEELPGALDAARRAEG